MSSQTDEPTAAKVDASRPERPDVFISYSRTDEAFVRRLVTALGEGGLDVWVDWEDIRKSADWRATIERGIEAAKVFVPVLSREQIASEICRHENACAAELNKRFVPLVRREVDRAELPEELNKPNWIWFREADDFGSSLEQLSDAIANDNDWLDVHARLLVRASEWERGRREGSLLLRGGDLRAAEAWLADQGSHKEHATPLQGAYIAAGRSAAKRRRQVVSGLTLFALAVAVGLAIAAFLQRNSAIENAKTARSRELAVRSAAELPADPELALLIALEADKAKRTPEAIAALRRALPASRVRTRIKTGAPVEEVSASSDGTLIRTRGSAGVRFWSARSGERRRGTGLGARFTALTPPRTFFRPAAYCNHEKPLSVAYSAAGNLFAVACENGHIRVVDNRNAEGPRFSIDSPEILPYSSVAMDFSPDGRSLAIAIHPNFSESGGGRTLIGGHSGEVWDTSTGKRVRLLRGHTSLLNGIAFDPTGQRIVTASEDKTARVWDAASGRSLFELRGHTGAVTAAAFVGTGQVVTGSADGTVRLWDVAADVPLASATLDARALPSWARPLRQEPNGVSATSRDGRYALLGTRRANGEVVDAKHGAHISTLHWAVRPYHSSFSPHGERILTIGGDAKTTAADAPPTVWESVSGRRLRTLGTSGYVYTGAFTPDGKRIVTGGEDGVVRLWSADEKGGAATAIGTAVGRIVSIAVSPDGRFVAVASRDTSARVWELGRETAPTLLTGHGDVTGVAFSPDGTLVVTSGDDRTARIWSTATGEELLSIPGQASQEVPAFFTSDGRRIVTLDSGDEIATLRRCEVCGDDDGIVEQAQHQVTRELDPAERRAFLGER